MKINEFADVIGADLIIRRYANQNNRFTCSFEDSEVMDGNLLRGTYGNGDSIDFAISDYTRQIRGKTIVFNAMRDNRKEYQVPQSLSV